MLQKQSLLKVHQIMLQEAVFYPCVWEASTLSGIYSKTD